MLRVVVLVDTRLWAENERWGERARGSWALKSGQRQKGLLVAFAVIVRLQDWSF